jgi:hypothetical protein
LKFLRATRFSSIDESIQVLAIDDHPAEGRSRTLAFAWTKGRKRDNRQQATKNVISR